MNVISATIPCSRGGRAAVGVVVGAAVASVWARRGGVARASARPPAERRRMATILRTKIEVQIIHAERRRDLND